MASNSETSPQGPTEIIDALQKGEHAALEAVQRFVDAVDDALPEPTLGEETPGRREITDAAFRMVDDLIGTSNDFARSVVKGSEQRFRATDGSDDSED